jgi:hypothetical protein
MVKFLLNVWAVRHRRRVAATHRVGAAGSGLTDDGDGNVIQSK